MVKSLLSDINRYNPVYLLLTRYVVQLDKASSYRHPDQHGSYLWHFSTHAKNPITPTSTCLMNLDAAPVKKTNPAKDNKTKPASLRWVALAWLSIFWLCECANLPKKSWN